MVKEELQSQDFYKELSDKLKTDAEKLSKLGYGINEDSIKKLSLSAKNTELTKDQDISCKTILNSLKINIKLNNKSVEFLNEYKNPTDEDKEYIKIQTKLLNQNTNQLEKMFKMLNNSYTEYLKDVSYGSIDFDISIGNSNENIKDDIYENLEGQMTIKDTFGNMSFESFISRADNFALENWYRFLQDLHESPIKSFVINKNTICNFKLVFKNPYTGLTTDKEAVVHLSHSTSSKKTPVFSIGSVSYKATSTGVKLLAGSLVTSALDNVPLPYLHAISYMNHSSVEDLPPLDLYIIPIENISEKGRYEVLLIKGIQFVDMKQNDNASSTGIYYAFNYFAEDIVPLDFSESEKYFKIQYEGNNNL